MVALGSLQVNRGTKVTLFNRHKPKVKPLTARDLKRLRLEVGELAGNEWSAVIDGVAYCVRVGD